MEAYAWRASIVNEHINNNLNTGNSLPTDTKKWKRVPFNKRSFPHLAQKPDLAGRVDHVLRVADVRTPSPTSLEMKTLTKSTSIGINFIFRKKMFTKVCDSCREDQQRTSLISTPIRNSFLYESVLLSSTCVNSVNTTAWVLHSSLDITETITSGW